MISNLDVFAQVEGSRQVRKSKQRVKIGISSMTSAYSFFNAARYAGNMSFLDYLDWLNQCTENQSPTSSPCFSGSLQRFRGQSYERRTGDKPTRKPSR